MKKGAKAVRGKNGLYGVLLDGGLLYDCDMPRAMALRVAELENSEKPPQTWEETAEILRKEGFDVD